METSVAREVRWWMAWRSMDQNIPWLTKHRDAVTSVHPAHHMIDVDFDGSLRLAKTYDPDVHVKPYVDMGLDVMPCIDFYVSSRSKSESAIMQGIVQGDANILATLQETAAILAKLADEHNFAGYVIDYEPSFDYTLDHVEGLMKFLSMLKQELSAYEMLQVEIDASAGNVVEEKTTKKRRVGVCISNWGIIDVTKNDFAKAYQSAADSGDVDFLMSMAYTYYPPQPGFDGFVELRKSCSLISNLFKECATIGIGVAANDKRYSNWFSLGDDALATFVRSLALEFNVKSISLWGRWYTEPENKVEEFMAPLVEFLKSDPARGNDAPPQDDPSKQPSHISKQLPSPRARDQGVCAHHFFLAPSERALYCKKCAFVKHTGLEEDREAAVSHDDKGLNRIEIVYAGYGADNEIPRDVTDVVRGRVHNGQRCFEASNKIAEGRDPHPCTVKSLFIVWKKNGRMYSRHVRERSGKTIEIE